MSEQVNGDGEIWELTVDTDKHGKRRRCINYLRLDDRINHTVFEGDPHFDCYIRAMQAAKGGRGGES